MIKKINNRIIEIKLNKWYTLWNWFINHVSNWIEKGFRSWNFYWKTNKNIVWSWKTVITVKKKKSFLLNVKFYFIKFEKMKNVFWAISFGSWLMFLAFWLYVFIALLIIPLSLQMIITWIVFLLLSKIFE